jgi:hypothetical protein
VPAILNVGLTSGDIDMVNSSPGINNMPLSLTKVDLMMRCGAPFIDSPDQYAPDVKPITLAFVCE